jgi:hypothetical protein
LISDYLDDKALEKLTGCKYARISYTAKFYINRYLQKTKQGKLPKVINPKTGSVAVIFVRKTHTAEDPRIMDDINLRCILDAINDTNTTMRDNYKGKFILAASFKTIVLMGDITLKETSSLQQDYKDLKLICLSSPFGKDTEGQSIWKTFTSQIDYLPVECKYLGIFLALKERYGASLAYVGFRSGTLDGPAFLGSPIFYLDNIPWRKNNLYRTVKKDYNFEDYSSGSYLYNLKLYQRVDLENKYLILEVPTPERMEELATLVNTFILINVKNNIIKEGNDILRLDIQAKVQLSSALLIFSICTSGEKRVWQTRIVELTERPTQIESEFTNNNPGNKGKDGGKIIAVRGGSDINNNDN